MANKLLFIDPDKTVVEELGPIFERRGFEVGWAADGESGLSKLLDDGYKAAVVELFLPKLSGADLIRKLRSDERGKRIPVILTSALLGAVDIDDDTVRERWGADRFLDKPLDPNILLWSVEELVESYAEAEEPAEAEEAGVEEARPKTWSFFISGIESTGSLKVLGVAELLGWLMSQAKTATLKLTHEGREATIYCVEGRPVRIDSQLSSEDLGEVLYHKGAIPIEEALLNLKTMETYRVDAKGQVQSTGKLDLAELLEVVEEAKKEKALAILEWHDGTFQIIDRVPAHVEPNITIGPEPLIARALSHADSDRLARMYELIGLRRARRVDAFADALLDDFMLDDEALALWDELRTEQTVARLVLKSSVSPAKAFRTFYYFLILGLVQLDRSIDISELRLHLLRPPEPEPAPKTEAAPDRVAREPAATEAEVESEAEAAMQEPVEQAVEERLPEGERLVDELIDQALKEPIEEPILPLEYEPVLDSELLSEPEGEIPEEVAEPLPEEVLEPAPPPEPRREEFRLIEEPYRTPPRPKPGSRRVDAAARPTPPPPPPPPAPKAPPVPERPPVKTVAPPSPPPSPPPRPSHPPAPEPVEPAAKPEVEAPPKSTKEAIMVAELSFRTGLNLLRQGNFVAARAEFQKALDTLPDEPEYNAYYAWATYRSQLPDPKTAQRIAEEHFKKAVELQSESDAILVLWGKYLKAKGNLSKAIVVLTRAIKINARNPEAQTELKNALALVAQKKLREEEEREEGEEPSLGKLLTKRIIK